MVETTTPNSSRPNSPDGMSEEEALREKRLQRNLKIIIGIMTFMIVAGLAAIAYRIIASPRGSSPMTASGTTAIAAVDGNWTLEIPAGAQLQSMALDGPRLAIHYDGPTGKAIMIVDITTGQRISTLRFQDAVPRN